MHLLLRHPVCARTKNRSSDALRTRAVNPRAIAMNYRITIANYRAYIGEARGCFGEVNAQSESKRIYNGISDLVPPLVGVPHPYCCCSLINIRRQPLINNVICGYNVRRFESSVCPLMVSLISDSHGCNSTAHHDDCKHDKRRQQQGRTPASGLASTLELTHGALPWRGVIGDASREATSCGRSPALRRSTMARGKAVWHTKVHRICVSPNRSRFVFPSAI